MIPLIHVFGRFVDMAKTSQSSKIVYRVFCYHISPATLKTLGKYRILTLYLRLVWSICEQSPACLDTYLCEVMTDVNTVRQQVTNVQTTSLFGNIIDYFTVDNFKLDTKNKPSSVVSYAVHDIFNFICVLCQCSFIEATCYVVISIYPPFVSSERIREYLCLAICYKFIISDISSWHWFLSEHCLMFRIHSERSHLNHTKLNTVITNKRYY